VTHKVKIETDAIWALTHLQDRLPAEDLRKLEARLLESAQRKRADRDVNQAADQALSFGQRVADGVAATMGSWRFILVQSGILAAWIALNVVEVLWRTWDPYPFILLNLVLSFQAAYAAPIIMMSQNRQSAKDRLQADFDLETNLKAETLIEELHGSVETLRIEQWNELLRLQQSQIDMLRALVGRLEAEAAGTPKPPAVGLAPAD
jgi:uncharacterized membrane protein